MTAAHRTLQLLQGSPYVVVRLARSLVVVLTARASRSAQQREGAVAVLGASAGALLVLYPDAEGLGLAGVPLVKLEVHIPALPVMGIDVLSWWAAGEVLDVHEHVLLNLVADYETPAARRAERLDVTRDGSGVRIRALRRHPHHGVLASRPRLLPHLRQASWRPVPSTGQAEGRQPPGRPTAHFIDKRSAARGKGKYRGEGGNSPA
mmetsp:Transcript_57277/g.153351  ORF Transcript_57277/g.153351 Transcript_57277/m.153351 type:complete len:206 (+) Transcript_57277:1956-2573(+)